MLIRFSTCCFSKKYFSFFSKFTCFFLFLLFFSIRIVLAIRFCVFLFCTNIHWLCNGFSTLFSRKHEKTTQRICSCECVLLRLVYKHYPLIYRLLKLFVCSSIFCCFFGSSRVNATCTCERHHSNAKGRRKNTAKAFFFV